MYTLCPATTADIPLLATIAREAFADDAHTQLKAANPRNPYDHGEVMGQALRGWLAVPERVDAVKAVDNATGKAAGWICWGRKGFRESAADQQPGPQAERGGGESIPDKLNEDSTRRERNPQGDASRAEQASTDDPLAPLATLTSSSMQYWMSKLMPPGRQCMYILSIAVAPSHQHRGIGQQLVRYGTEKADAAGVYSWVHASEAGARLFETCGFQEVGRLEVDLETWVEKIEAATAIRVRRRGDNGWGTYCFRYMKREVRA